MGYLVPTGGTMLDAKLTNIGRKKIAQGNFNVKYFQIGDSEFDYGFSTLNGSPNDSQRIIYPMDKHSVVKYPYLISQIASGTTTGTTFGTPISFTTTDTISNLIGSAGMISGTTVKTHHDVTDTDAIQFNKISFPAFTVDGYYNVGDFITLTLKPLNGDNITGQSSSYIYKITGIVDDQVTVDRYFPDWKTLVGVVPLEVVLNDFTDTDIYEGQTGWTSNGQQDAWNLNTVWTEKPIGMTGKTLDQYQSNVYVSTKEYFGYTTSDGQTVNSGTTITNMFGENIIVSPEEQHSIAIVHYSKQGDPSTNPYKVYKYDDYIGSDSQGQTYFQISLPFVQYDRITGSTTGVTFYMDTIDYYINSTAIDSWANNIKYRYLVDSMGNKVGKIFLNEEVIVFDDQELVAVLDMNSNRRHTLPIPKIGAVPTDIKCVTGSSETPMMSGNTTGKTFYVTYQLEFTSGGTEMYSLPCNHYLKLTGSTIDSDISIKFSDDPNVFQFMKTGITGITSGYVADKFYILVQEVIGNGSPNPTSWTAIDFTNELTLNTEGLIDPSSLRGTRFVISRTDFDGGTPYVWIGNDNFGVSQVLPGSVKIERSTDIQVMNYRINLPSGTFEKTQNPTHTTGNKYITEVGLFNENYEMVVTGKFSVPVKRIGTQVIAVKLDI